MRRLHHLVALHVLLADVEQADARCGAAVDVARDDRAHGGELAQLLGRRLGVGAQVEHVSVAVGGGNRRDDGGALDSGQHTSSTKCAIAVSAPVLPALTQAQARRPRARRSTATRIEESFLRRIASRGFSSIATTCEAGTICARPRTAAGSGASAASSSRGSPTSSSAQLTIVGERAQRAGNVLARLVVAAHHVDRDRQHAGP